MFDSKTFLYNSLKLDHRTLDKYLENGRPYFSRFIFSYDPISSMSVDALLVLEDLKSLFSQARKDKTLAELQSKSRPIVVENIKNPDLTAYFPSLNACAAFLKGDRYTIRKYLKANSVDSYYRGQ